MWVGGHIICSPCVGICKLENAICIGCYRTTEQIINWINYTDKERDRIMKESKPAIATADVELIRKVISYYLKYASPPNKELEEKLLSLHHRVGRL